MKTNLKYKLSAHEVIQYFEDNYKDLIGGGTFYLNTLNYKISIDLIKIPYNIIHHIRMDIHDSNFSVIGRLSINKKENDIRPDARHFKFNEDEVIKCFDELFKSYLIEKELYKYINEQPTKQFKI